MQQQNKLIDMMDTIAQAMKPLNDMMELAAIRSNGIRFAPGDEISIDEDNNPVKLTVRPTHKILSCWGMLNDSLHEIKAENLKTKQVITIAI